MKVSVVYRAGTLLALVVVTQLFWKSISWAPWNSCTAETPCMAMITQDASGDLLRGAAARCVEIGEEQHLPSQGY